MNLFLHQIDDFPNFMLINYREDGFTVNTIEEIQKNDVVSIDSISVKKHDELFEEFIQCTYNIKTDINNTDTTFINGVADTPAVQYVINTLWDEYCNSI